VTREFYISPDDCLAGEANLLAKPQHVSNSLFFGIPGLTMLQTLENNDPASRASRTSTTKMGMLYPCSERRQQNGLTFVGFNSFVIRQIMNQRHLNLP
jgi:hypothetical protein